MKYESLNLTGNVRILIGSLKIAVYAHAKYTFGQNSPERLARRQMASSCNAFAIATFSSSLLFFVKFISIINYH